MSSQHPGKFLKMVICFDGAIDNAFKISTFLPCDDPSFKTDEQYAVKNCPNKSNFGCLRDHICAPVAIKGDDLVVEKGQKSIFLVFYHCFHMGDQFCVCDASMNDEAVYGCYLTKKSALTALQLPLTSELPDGTNDVTSPVKPPGFNGELHGEIWGELHCREYAVTGW